MSTRTSNIILLGMVLGAVLGAFGGYYFGDVFIQIKFLGTLFLNALKMIVVPLIVASMIVGVTSLGDIRKLGRTTGKTLVYYLATTSFAVIIGIILVNIIQPGSGINGVGSQVPEMVAQSKGTTFSDFMVGLIPENLISAAAEGSVLPLIIFSLIFGGVLTAIGQKGKPVIDFFVGLNTAIMKIVVLIIYFAPIGIIAIIGSIVAENRGSLAEIVSGLGLYSLTVIIGLLIHAVIVLPLILKFFGRRKPFQYFLNMGQALATAFTTASSSATLPLTMEAVEEKNKVNPKASAFVLPLGATINMDGTALYEAVAAIFIAQAINFPLTVESQIIIFLTATLASIGAAAIPHAGLVTMVIVLSAVGLPLEGIGFIFAVDWFLDRCRTTVNVWGDSVGAAVIGETAEIKTYLRPAQTAKPGAAPAPSKQEPRERPRQVRQPRDSRTDSRKGPGKPQQDGRKRDKRRSNGDARHDKGGKYGRTGRGDRPGYQPRETLPEKKMPVVIPDKPSKPPVAEKKVEEVPRDTIDKELEKVRQQLASMGNDSANEDTSAEKSQPLSGSGEKYFDIEFSKIDFFGDKDKITKPKKEIQRDLLDLTPESVENRPEPPVYTPLDDSTEKHEMEPESDEEAPISEDSESFPEPTESRQGDSGIEKDEKVPVQTSAIDEEESDEEDDFWGRDKKKRPSR
ncbi:MAG: cation:dicarboxylase symporter family transporter [Candidatus Zixiibacteriota bacterium]